MATKLITESLVEFIRNDSRYPSDIATEAGVSPGIVSRLLSGERAPTLRTVDRLCQTLQLELKPARPARKQVARRKSKRSN